MNQSKIPMLQSPHSAKDESTIPLSPGCQTIGVQVREPQQWQPKTVALESQNECTPNWEKKTPIQTTSVIKIPFAC